MRSLDKRQFTCLSSATVSINLSMWTTFTNQSVSQSQWHGCLFDYLPPDPQVPI